jgi:hypothetical protein
LRYYLFSKVVFIFCIILIKTGAEKTIEIDEPEENVASHQEIHGDDDFINYEQNPDQMEEPPFPSIDPPPLPPIGVHYTFSPIHLTQLAVAEKQIISALAQYEQVLIKRLETIQR